MQARSGVVESSKASSAGAGQNSVKEGDSAAKQQSPGDPKTARQGEACEGRDCSAGDAGNQIQPALQMTRWPKALLPLPGHRDA